MWDGDTDLTGVGSEEMAKDSPLSDNGGPSRSSLVSFLDG